MIIVPDVHGRDFWKEAVKGRESEEIVFLGDYVDPYTGREDITSEEAIVSLLEIIAFKKAHLDNVTLLLGNHDLNYIASGLVITRHSYQDHNLIHGFFDENFELFDIAHEKHINGMRYLFTHAGLLPGWLKQQEDAFGSIEPGKEVETLNRLLHSNSLFQALDDVSRHRGGCSEAGSIVWADVNEHIDNEHNPDDGTLANTFQIFGHTLMENPLITDTFACIDCCRAFVLDDNGQLNPI